MKTKLIFIGIVISHLALGQTFTENISRELTFEKPSAVNALVIANINGNIKVEGYDGESIILEAVKSIDAKTDARLELGKTEVQLGIIDRADTIIVYVIDGCNQFVKKKSRADRFGWHQAGWSYQSTDPQGCHTRYDYKMDLTVRVPNSVNLLASTINEGSVVVENVNGGVKAANINGSIRLVNLKREAEAHTINGDLDIEYALNPGRECRFYSLNGDINALFQSGLAANVSFESFNGSFYTNVADIESIPDQVKKSTRGDGVHYKINGNRFKIGRGGALLDFETFNGNVYVKETKK